MLQEKRIAFTVPIAAVEAVEAVEASVVHNVKCKLT
jgi:hypothetical protein